MGASVSSFVIELDRPDGVYFAGEVVTGKVRLISMKEIKLRGIHITLSCIGVMRYVSQGDKSSNTYTGSKVYEEQRRTLFGSYYNPEGPVVESIYLPKGTFECPFSFEVRADAIGSAETRGNGWGTIRHSLVAYVDVGTNKRSSERFFNENFVDRFIPVLPLRPLPSPDLLRAIGHTGRPVNLARGCLLPCLSDGNFSIEAKLMRQAFAPGEMLDFQLRVNNNTSKALEVKVELICSQVLRSEGYLINKHPSEVGDLMFCDTVQPFKMYEIGHDVCDPNFSSAQVATTANVHLSEELHLNNVRQMKLPVVPPSFNGAPGVLPSTAGYDPVTFAYSVKFTAGTPGICGTRTSITIPVVVCAAPPSAAALQSAHAANSAIPAAIQPQANIVDPFLLQYRRDYVPDVANEASPVPRMVAMAPTWLSPHDSKRKYQPYGLSFASTEGQGAAPAPSLTGSVSAGKPVASSMYDRVNGGYASVAPELTPSAPAAAFMDRSTKSTEDPVSALIDSLRSSADLRATVRVWAASTNIRVVHDFSPESLQRVLQSVSISSDQVVVALELSQVCHCTCAHVVTALAVCQFYQTDLAAGMAPYVQDGANKALVLSLLSVYDQDKVEALFHKA